MRTPETVSIEGGRVVALGGSHARVGDVNSDGEMTDFTLVKTPQEPGALFGWMAPQILEAAHNGRWVVSGFPGPVSPDGTMIGPLANVPGLAARKYNLVEELVKADSAMDDLLRDPKCTFLPRNDADLAVQAAGEYLSREEQAFNYYEKLAIIILGTGVGGGAGKRDSGYTNVLRIDRSNPLEIGHAMLSDDPTDTVEKAIAAPALSAQYGDLFKLDKTSPAWERVGKITGRLVLNLGLDVHADLVVPVGGIGIGASEKYRPHLEKSLERIQREGNETQKDHLPKVAFIDPGLAQTFEILGGPGIVRDFKTRNGVSQ